MIYSPESLEREKILGDLVCILFDGISLGEWGV